MIRSALVLMILAFAGAAGASVAFVDNRAPAGGDGSRERPFATIAQGARIGTIVYVAESDAPYEESVALRRGQMLIGSAFGLDALQTDLHVNPEITGVPAMKGPGPAIHGTISVAGDNVIAGCTLFAEGWSGIAGSGAIGTLTVRDVYIKSSRAGFAIYLQEQQGKVDIAGGSIEATQAGSGIGLDGGYGEVVIDRFPISGDFTTAVRIQNRRSGAVTFKRGSKVRVRDAFDDAVVIAAMPKPTAIRLEDSIEVRGRRRGLVVNNVANLAIAGSSNLSTANGAALDVRDSGVELSFQSVSAEGVAPGTLDEGIILDRVHGHVAITGISGKIGTGGTIAHAQGNGIRIAQTTNVRMAGITLTDSGVNKPVRGARCAGNFEVNSTAVCRAALYLRHVTDSVFENVVIDGGSAMGINANNIRNVTFGGLDVHRAGDETFESGVLVQEASGTITFSRSSFADNAGSEMLIEQRFNSGKIALERCTFSATGRPDVAPHLIEVRTSGNGSADVQLRNGDLRDNLGAAIEASASESSSLAIDVLDSSIQHFAHGVVAVSSRQSGKAQFTMQRNFVVAQASDRPLVDVSAADGASVCADISANRFSGAPGTVIRIASTPRATMRIAGLPSADANAIAAANGGAAAVIDGPAIAGPPCR